MKIQEIKDYIIEQGSDCLNNFGGKYRGGIFLQQNPDEISEVLYFLLNNGSYESMLEVGSASGANAKVFCEILKINNLFIIDDNKHDQHPLRSKNLSKINYKEYIGNSQGNEAPQWLRSFNKKFDIVYIDADHSYQGVRNDVNNYLEFLKDDGFIIFHDSMGCEGVNHLIEDYKNTKLKEIFSVKIKCGITICKSLSK
jgi:predicted O-methyltransferase YrrM